MNFEKKISATCHEDKINISANSDERLSSIVNGMPVNQNSCSNQEEGSSFSNVIIKCEEPEISDSDTSNVGEEMKLVTEMKVQTLDTVNTNEHSDLNVKPDPFEIKGRVKQEFVSTGFIDATIKYEETKIDSTKCKETKRKLENSKYQVIRSVNNEQFDFNASNTSVKYDPLATETYIKQENEVYVSPSFSKFSDDRNEVHNRGDDHSVSVKSKQSQVKKKNKTSFQCDVCNETFTRKGSLISHILTHTGEKPYKCDICNKHLSSSRFLNNHKRIHTREKPYRCEVCNKTFNRSNDLNKHKNIHTGTKPYQCDICNKCFTQRNTLKIHKRLHSDEKPYKCDICNKCFNQRVSLTVHKLLHSGEKPYQCDVCNKCFTQRNTLKIHKRSHSGEKPYQCDVCSKTFSQSRNLSTHKLTHTGEKPYQCDVCSKTFNHVSHLKGHKRTHTGEKPYRCDICNKSFSKLRSLSTHKLTHTE